MQQTAFVDALPTLEALATAIGRQPLYRTERVRFVAAVCELGETDSRFRGLNRTQLEALWQEWRANAA